MKKIITILMSMAATAAMQAQMPTNLSEFSSAQLMKTAADSEFNLDDVKGSPYYYEEYLPGEMFYENTEFPEKELYRYNALFDEIEIKTDIEDPNYVVKTAKIDVVINGEKFVYRQYFDEETEQMKFGFLVVYTENEKYSVYKRYFKELQEPKKSNTAITPDTPAKINGKPKFYYKDKNTTKIEEVSKSKKTYIKAYPSKDVKGYFKSHKVNFKSTDDIIALLEFCNS